MLDKPWRCHGKGEVPVLAEERGGASSKCSECRGQDYRKALARIYPLFAWRETRELLERFVKGGTVRALAP